MAGTGKGKGEFGLQLCRVLSQKIQNTAQCWVERFSSLTSKVFLTQVLCSREGGAVRTRGFNIARGLFCC